MRLGWLFWAGNGTPVNRVRAVSLLVGVMDNADFDTQGRIERFFSRKDLPGTRTIKGQLSGPEAFGIDSTGTPDRAPRNALEILERSTNEKAVSLWQMLHEWRVSKDSGARVPVRRTNIEEDLDKEVKQ